MTVLSRAQLYNYAQQAGFSGAALDEVVAVALAESGGDTTHVNTNKSGSTAVVNGKTVNVPPGTQDFGVLQINTWWNPSVTVAQAEDPNFAFKWAYQMTGGKQPTSTSDPFKPFWVTVQNGMYKKYLQPTGSNVAGNTSSTSTSTSTSTAGSGGNYQTDPCLNCGAVGSSAYSQCHAALAAKVGTVPSCAQSAIASNQGVVAQQANAVVPGLGDWLTNTTSTLTGISSTLGDIGQVWTWLQGNGHRIVLLLIALVLLGAALFILAGSGGEK